MFIELLATGKHHTDLTDCYEQSPDKYEILTPGMPVISTIGWTALPSQTADLRQALGLRSLSDPRTCFTKSDIDTIDFEALERIAALSRCGGLGTRMKRLLEADFAIWYRDER